LTQTSPRLKLVVDRDTEFDPHDWLPPLDYRVDRRAALRLLSLTSLAALTGCATNITAATTSSSATTATTTTLTSSATSTTTGTSIALTATVSPSAATGIVTFYNGTTSLGSASLSAGSASIAISFSTAGTESLTAVYAGNATYAASTSSAVSVTVTGVTTSCATQTLEGEEGPYFVDDSAAGYNRVNILSNLDGSSIQTGVPFSLTLYVYDAKNSCAAMQNVQIDIWHCNATGLYSAESVESTVGQSWLRGYQLTDSTGKAQFTTIIPGWYSGRTTHIHLRLRSSYDSSSTGGTNTMQVFFDQTTVDTIYTTISPYSARGKADTTNAADHVYTGEENGTTLMTLTGNSTAGYAATAKVYLPIS
jgi:protocatechuate 3,4-dioxygenase beta subunit